MFSKRSSSSISLATVTPSLVTVGPPKDLSMMTFLPVGPMVTATALASFSTPWSILARARSSKRSCLGILSNRCMCCVFLNAQYGVLRLMGRRSLEASLSHTTVTVGTAHPTLANDFGEDVAFAEDFYVVAGNFDVGAAVLAV